MTPDISTGPVTPGSPPEGGPPPSGAPTPSGAPPERHPSNSEEQEAEVGDESASDRFAELRAAIADAEVAEAEADTGAVGDDGGADLLDGEVGGESERSESASPLDAAGEALGLADGDDLDDIGPIDYEAECGRLFEDLDRLQGERNEYLEQLLRTKADFENYRKRVLKQQAEQVERAAEALVEKLLEILDVYDGARAHAEGFEQVGSSLMALLEKEGLERIDPAGSAFDPTEADAVAHEEGDEGPVVASVLRPGYRWKGRVVRPAMVKVRG